MNEELVERLRDVIAEVMYEKEMTCLDAARACLSAIEAEGLVIVPREPTEEMRRKGEDAFDEYLTDPDGTVLTYQAMIAAALTEK